LIVREGAAAVSGKIKAAGDRLKSGLEGFLALAEIHAFPISRLEASS
jgi:hypothetical protein